MIPDGKPKAFPTLSWGTFFTALFLTYAALVILAALVWVGWEMANRWVAGAIVDALREVVR